MFIERFGQPQRLLLCEPGHLLAEAIPLQRELSHPRIEILRTFHLPGAPAGLGSSIWEPALQFQLKPLFAPLIPDRLHLELAASRRRLDRQQAFNVGRAEGKLTLTALCDKFLELLEGVCSREGSGLAMVFLLREDRKSVV